MNWDTEEISDGSFRHDPNSKVILVTISLYSSKTGARNKSREVHQVLAAHGIDLKLIAVDPANPRSNLGTNWHVLRKSEHVGRLRRAITGKLRHGSWLDRTISPLILGSRQVVIAVDEASAEERRKELHLQRGESVNETRVLQRLDSPAPTPQPAPSPIGRSGVVWWLILWVPLIVILFFLVRDGFEPIWMIALYVIWVLIGVVIRYRRAGTGPKAKFDAFAVPSIAAVVLAWFAGSALHNVVINSPSAALFLVALVLLVAGFGLNVQLRRWRLASRLSAHAPLAITIGAFLTPLWGYVTYGVYLETLGLPFGTVKTGTLEQAWAAAWTFIYWALAVLAFAAVLGLVQWVFGDETGGLGFFAWMLALAILSTSMLTSLRHAAEAADTRSQGLPQSWYGITPELACIRSSTSATPGAAPSVSDPITPTYGPPFNAVSPYIVLGTTDQNEWVVLSLEGSAYWTIPQSRVQIEPIGEPATVCT